MPAINFPASPSINDTFTSSGKTWKWNGTFWELVVSGASVADGSVSTAKISDAAITNPKLASGAVHSVNIASGAVTAAKLGNDIQLTPPDGSITQAKLAASLSGITVTTTANRGTAVASPFTGQTIYLSDVKRVQIWDGSAWMFVTNGAPGAPTALSATPLSTTSVSLAFTPGESAGASPINYKYSLSTNGGSSYGEPIALDPADITSPVTISGLTGGQTYHIKLRAVSDFGDSPDSTATSVAVPTVPSAPTSLSATPSATSVEISFTPGADGGSPITNYQYATSTNGGSTYSSFTALSPADGISPITITGLTEGTEYSVKLKAVSAFGAGAESAQTSFKTSFNIDVLMAGGGGGAGSYSGGGGAGEVLLISRVINPGTYSLSIGAGGAGTTSQSWNNSRNGNQTTGFSETAKPGGGGRSSDDRTVPVTGLVGIYTTVANGGGGSSRSSGYYGTLGTSIGSGVTRYGGNRGGQDSEDNQAPNYPGGGGGGAGASVTGNSGASNATAGGIGIQSSITGTSYYFGGGGGGGTYYAGVGGNGGNGGGGGGSGGSGGGTAGAGLNTGGAGSTGAGGSGGANTGGGGGGGRGETTASGGNGGSGVIIMRYLTTSASSFTFTIGVGLTSTATISGSYTVRTFTAGSGNLVIS